MLIFDRAGEVIATVAECSPHPVILTSDQIELLERFTAFAFREIAKPKKLLLQFPTFDPSIASSGYYIMLLKDAPDSHTSSLNGIHHHKEIAFDFMHSIEHALGSFVNPTDPPPPDMTNPEIFRDAVVTAVYNENRIHYYVADIRYDLSPADPFPNSEAAGTFAEYYQIRYGVKVSLDQPMLDVDHTSSRLNFLMPRYQSIRGQLLSVPEKDSKRSQKSKVYVIPEVCSIHPVPAFLWRQLFNLPAVLYRMESLLVAEEFRSHIASVLGVGAVDWPSDVPLPLLTMGEMVGEEIVCQTDSATEKSSNQPSCRKATETSTSLYYRDLSGALMDLQISTQETQDELAAADSLPLQDHSNAHRTTHSLSKDVNDKTVVKHSGTEDKTSCLAASSEVSHDFSRAKEDSFHSGLFDRKASVPLDYREALHSDNSKTAIEMESEVSPVTIWTDPHISSLYQKCGPPSTLILRALTTGMAGDVFSLERLEILGDSFLKYAITSSVFFKYRYENEGKLSFTRGLRVSNRQLFYLARQRGLPSYVITRMFTPLVNWLPPGFYQKDGTDTKGSGEGHFLLMADKDTKDFDDEDEDGSIFEGVERPELRDGRDSQSSDIQLNHYLHLCCTDKTIADTTEALVGAYLLSLGPEGAFKFVEWLGVELTKQEETQGKCLVNGFLAQDSAVDAVDLESDYSARCQDISKVPFQACQTCCESVFSSEERVSSVLSTSGILSNHRSTAAEFHVLEEVLNYRFHDKSLLLQAFTHTSVPRDYNSVRCSYEQLEFLGDALLDFLLTRYLYINHSHMPPGELTDLRSAVVNNYSFAALAVQMGFPKHLRSLSPQLFSMVNKFTVKLKEKEIKQQQGKTDEVKGFFKNCPGFQWSRRVGTVGSGRNDGGSNTSISATIRHSTVNKGTLLRYSSIYHRLYNNPSYSRSHIENAIYTENVASLIATGFLPNCTTTQKTPQTHENCLPFFNCNKKSSFLCTIT